MGKKDDVMVDCETYDDGSGDRAECCGIRQQAEHFKAVNEPSCSCSARRSARKKLVRDSARNEPSQLASRLVY
ncbi:hypothetical protein LINPERHAP1_LOCUS34331 [Linum perenne]